jgi:hypothetical protein
MSRFIALLAAFGLIAAALPVQAAKPVPKPAPAVTFDARDPASLVALLATLAAKGEIASTADDAVFLRVTTPAYGFGAQYAGCDPQHRACKALAFTTQSDKGAPTLAQLNSFNQTSITCRAWQDRAGKPHVMYAALVFAHDSRETMTAHLGAWQGCLATFGEFLADPVAYLASAP